ncbi:serine hydrolase domain-containing protein [Flammeovirgaceae bacterium SG7u.111]|nr:serine hydrolase domain-containing protein [Flammeovirgaceae bacterium SG7u.132]WPO35819.1 serine hydrolase domain-containing protein [Flammeovirgaceae bacterium SG7u.111]
MKKKLYFILLLFMALSVEVSAQHFHYYADSLLEDFEKYDGFSGTVMVLHKGLPVYTKSLGFANIEWQIPNSLNTKFYIASISKQFTAAVILQLEQEGKINLKAPITTYIPNYRKDTGKKITIHHLLSHRSGLPNYTSIPFVWEDSLRNHYSIDEMVEKLCSGDLETKPGTVYNYNNTGYFLLAKVIENVERKPYREVLKSRIFIPLEMNNTGVPKPQEIISNLANGYTLYRGQFSQANYTYMPNLAGAGNIYTTVGDLLKWNDALNRQTILSPKSMELMQTPYSEGKEWIFPYENGYGYGVGISDIGISANESTKLIFHSGHISGYSGFFARFIEEQTTVIILSNMGNISTPNMNKLSVALMQLVKNAERGFGD